MGLLDQVLGAIANPNQQASSGQMASILNTVQQVSDSYGTNPATMNTAMSVVGNFVRSSLQQKRETGGEAQAEAIVNQFSGISPNPQAVNSLFSPSQLQGVVQEVAARTGLNPQMIQQILPILVPLVLNFLQSGNNNSNGGNPVLNSFLDADGDGDVDISDAMQMAGRYMSR